MILEIFDDEDGILLEFDFENGFAINIRLDDKSAQELVNIIQNKLNARW